MATWWKTVYSSNVIEVGYDAENNDLLIKFKTGKVYAYKGVPEELAMQLSTAPSVGSMLNAEIKPFYSYRQV